LCARCAERPRSIRDKTMPKAAIISLKVAAFLAALVPFGLLVYGGFTNNLGPDPIATLTHTTGDWTIRFLLITLAIAPLRRLSVHLNWLVRFRRMMGLYAFFYRLAASADLRVALFAIRCTAHDRGHLEAKIYYRGDARMAADAASGADVHRAGRSARWEANAGRRCTGWSILPRLPA